MKTEIIISGPILNYKDEVIARITEPQSVEYESEQFEDVTIKIPEIPYFFANGTKNKSGLWSSLGGLDWDLAIHIALHPDELPPWIELVSPFKENPSLMLEVIQIAPVNPKHRYISKVVIMPDKVITLGSFNDWADEAKTSRFVRAAERWHECLRKNTVYRIEVGKNRSGKQKEGHNSTEDIYYEVGYNAVSFEKARAIIRECGYTGPQELLQP